MKDKIVFITGATSGIGKETALDLASQGAHVVIHGRNKDKAEQVKQEIIVACGHQNVDVIIGDVSSLQDVRKMANDFLSKYDRLDVLVNNAGGVMDAKRQITIDGLERTFAVNVASLFLLTALLFDALKKSDDGRVVNISSMAHKFGKNDIDDLQLSKKYSSNRAYGNAKLYVVCLTEEMDRRMKDAGILNVSVNALHPGVVKTNFAKESKGSMMKFFFTVFGIFFISPKTGAKTTIHLASSPLVKGISGKYFAKSKLAKVKRTFITQDGNSKLWKQCEEICNITFL